MLESIRKFGLEYCDLPTMLWNVTVMLRALTLDIDSRFTKPVPVIFYIISILVAACYFYVYLISMIWFVAWKCTETGDMLNAIIVFSLGIASEIGTTKLIFMFLYRNTVKELVDGSLACDRLVQPNSRFSYNLLKALRNVKKRAMAFWFVFVFNGVAYVSKPLFLPGRHLMEDSFILYGLDPIFETPNYQIAYMVMLIGCFFTCYLTANISAFLIITAGNIEARMLALSQELLEVWDDAQKYCSERSNTLDFIFGASVNTHDEDNYKLLNQYVAKRLGEIAQIHMMNIDLIGKIEDVFRGAIAAEFMLLVVSLIAELLGGLENTYLEVPFALMQVSMDCLTGQRVIDASLTFENAVYSCRWENFNVPNRKTVLLMLINAQKPMTLSAGGIIILNFISLMAIVKSIYSAYTTLRTTMD